MKRKFRFTHVPRTVSAGRIKLSIPGWPHSPKFETRRIDDPPQLVPVSSFLPSIGLSANTISEDVQNHVSNNANLIEKRHNRVNTLAFAGLFIVVFGFVLTILFLIYRLKTGYLIAFFMTLLGVFLFVHARILSRKSSKSASHDVLADIENWQKLRNLVAEENIDLFLGTPNGETFLVETKKYLKSGWEIFWLASPRTIEQICNDRSLGDCASYIRRNDAERIIEVISKTEPTQLDHVSTDNKPNNDEENFDKDISGEETEAKKISHNKIQKLYFSSPDNLIRLVNDRDYVNSLHGTKRRTVDFLKMILKPDHWLIWVYVADPVAYNLTAEREHLRADLSSKFGNEKSQAFKSAQAELFKKIMKIFNSTSSALQAEIINGQRLATKKLLADYINKRFSIQ